MPTLYLLDQLYFLEEVSSINLNILFREERLLSFTCQGGAHEELPESPEHILCCSLQTLSFSKDHSLSSRPSCPLRLRPASPHRAALHSTCHSASLLASHPAEPEYLSSGLSIARQSSNWAIWVFLGPLSAHYCWKKVCTLFLLPHLD